MNRDLEKGEKGSEERISHHNNLWYLFRLMCVKTGIPSETDKKIKKNLKYLKPK